MHFPGVKFSVRSRGYAGGNSIDVSWTDGPMSGVVNSIADKYQKGRSDAMTDSYEYNNLRDDIPQVRYVFTQRRETPPAQPRANPMPSTWP